MPFPSRRYRHLAVPALCLFVAQAHLDAAPPAWWTDRDIIVPSLPAKDFAVANSGQLKNIVVAAYEEFLAKIPSSLNGIGGLTAPNPMVPTDKGGTGWRLQRLVQTWVKLNPDGTVKRSSGHLVKQDDPLLMGPAAQDFAAIRQGQLKNVALPFYDRLSELYRKPNGQHFFGGPYPKAWTGLGATDYAAANLGQLKAVFSFNLEGDRDGDGLSDLAELIWNFNNSTSADLKNPFSSALADNDSLDDTWEMIHFGDLANTETGDYDLDGVSNLDEFNLPSNPASFFDPDSDGISNREESLLGTNPLQSADFSSPATTGLVIYIP